MAHQRGSPQTWAARVRLVAVILTMAMLSMACGGGGAGAGPTPVVTATATPTPPPTLLSINSQPRGANAEINPRKSSTTGAYLPGTGRPVGSTPVTATLQPGDFVVNGSCGTIIVYVWEAGYFGAVDIISTCLPNGASGTPVPHPSYTWYATLSACPANLPKCGQPNG